MAGIGEASAIITIAQVGINLSIKIFEFATEIRDARGAIYRIGRDICTTSERLEEVGRLIQENNKTKLFSETGIASAVRCSKDCKDIIDDVNKVLAKAGWVPGSADLDKKNLDISLFETLRWPFVKTQLVDLQADLEKVKASLSLLFNSVMANASSNPLQSKYALEIPRLKRWAEKATREAENSKRRMHNVDSKGKLSFDREVLWEDEKGEEDAEIRQKFVEYQARLVKEEEERKFQERAAFVQAEKIKQQRAEEVIRQEIEQSAINNYKREQDEIETLNLEREKQLKEALARLKVEPEKIESIIQIPCLQVSARGSADKNRSFPKTTVPPSDEREDTKTQNDESFEAASMAPDKTRFNSSRLSWISKNMHKKPSRIRGDPISSSKFEPNYGLHSTSNTELWLIDVLSGRGTELQPCRAWLRSKIENQRHHNISHKLAQLKQPWMNSIYDFLQFRNRNEVSNKKWKLLLIELPRRVPKTALFGHRHGGYLVQLIVCQQGETDGAAISPPESLHSKAHVSDSSTLTQPDANFSPESIENLPAQGVRSSFKHSNGLHAKDENEGRQLDSKNVFFTADATLPKIRSPDPTVMVEQEDFDRDSGILRGSTLVRKDLIPPTSLRQLGIPFRYFSENPNDDPQQFLKVPRILAIDQLVELVRVTKAKILNNEAPWRKLPELVIVLSGRQFDSSGIGIDKNGEPKAHAMIMSQTKNGLSREGELENVRNGERTHDRPRETALDVDKRHRAIDHGTSEYPTIRRRSMPSRRNSRLDLIYDPNGVTQAPQSRAPRRKDNYKEVDRETSPERSRDRQIIKWDRDEDGTFHRPGNSDEFEFFGRRANVRKRSEETDFVPKTFIPEEGRSQSRQRPADEDFRNDTTIFTRRSERRASPPNRSYTRSDDQRVGQLVLREASPVSRQSDGRNSASRELVHLRHDDNQPRRFSIYASNRLSRSRSRLRKMATNDHYSDSDSERHALPLRQSRSASRTDARDDEIITSQLRRFTTFNRDADNDLMLSPAQMESSGQSDNDEPPIRTLEQATRKLDELYAKLDVATKNQDSITASDLRFYAIPNVNAEVQELKVRKAKKSKGQEAAWGEGAKVHEILDIDKLKRREGNVVNVPLPKETSIHADKSIQDSNNETNHGNQTFLSNNNSNTFNTRTPKPTIKSTESVREPTQTTEPEPEPRPEESNDVLDNEPSPKFHRRPTVQDEMEPTEA